jgi:hypothetical protein
MVRDCILGDFSFVKIFLTKLSCYHDNFFKYFMFGKYNGFVSKAMGNLVPRFKKRTLGTRLGEGFLYACTF